MRNGGVKARSQDSSHHEHAPIAGSLRSGWTNPHRPRCSPLLLLVGAQWGRALSPVDAHLLSSALLSPGTQSWTRDKGLKASATKLHAVTVD